MKFGSMTSGSSQLFFDVCWPLREIVLLNLQNSKEFIDAFFIYFSQIQASRLNDEFNR